MLSLASWPWQLLMQTEVGMLAWGRQAGNGMGQEDSAMVIEQMAQAGTEPTYCMGDDIPLPVLSDKPHPLFGYFKQRFAQVWHALHPFMLCTLLRTFSCSWCAQCLLCASSSLA